MAAGEREPVRGLLMAVAAVGGAFPGDGASVVAGALASRPERPRAVAAVLAVAARGADREREQRGRGGGHESTSAPSASSRAGSAWL